MKKISILDQFAADAINAPAVVTGGKGCGKSTKAKTKKKSGSKKSKKKSGKSGGGCNPKPVCW